MTSVKPIVYKRRSYKRPKQTVDTLVSETVLRLVPLSIESNDKRRLTQPMRDRRKHE